jgi:hypothetical protein
VTIAGKQVRCERHISERDRFIHYSKHAISQPAVPIVAVVAPPMTAATPVAPPMAAACRVATMVPFATAPPAAVAVVDIIHAAHVPATGPADENPIVDSDQLPTHARPATIEAIAPEANLGNESNL